MREIIVTPSVGEFTQGAILNCLKTDEKNKAFGLVISARCDIAHRKSKTILCLPIYPLSEWMEKIGKPEILSSSKKQIERIYQQILASNNLSLRSFEVYGYERTIAALTAKGAKKQDIDEIEKLRPYLEKAQFIPKLKALKEAHNRLLDSVWRNVRMDSHFIERVQPDESVHGYVVDFTQPITLTRSLLDELALGVERFKYERDSSGVYAQIFLGELDQGEIISILKSPYIEQILQRFTHYYSRIGTSDIADNDLNNLKGKYEIA